MPYTDEELQELDARFDQALAAADLQCKQHFAEIEAEVDAEIAQLLDAKN